jgi:hypothetical protein
MPNEIEQAVKAFAARNLAYRTYREYYDGQQPLHFATDKFRNAFGSVFGAVKYNLCGAILDTVADRLEVTGFGVQGAKEGDGATQGTDAWELWQANRMDLRAGQVHQEALREGDAYCIVWPDSTGAPTLYPQRADLVTVQYDEEQPGRITWAAKHWRIPDGRIRLNVYYPERIEKWVTPNKADALPEKAGSYQPWEEPTVPNPWGVVPVFHFANNSGIGEFGRSELRDVVPLQDAMNKALCDLLVAMEYVSFPQRWVTGLELEIDPVTGKPKLPFTPGVDRVWTLESETSRFGEYPQADLQNVLGVISDLEMKICRVVGVPPHYMAVITDPPSGEALKTLEARFVKKLRDRQGAFGNAWEDALSLALRMAGKGEAALSCEWADPAPKTEKETAETVQMKRDIGVSKRQALLELGYAEEDVERMLAEGEEERALALPDLANPFGRQAPAAE